MRFSFRVQKGDNSSLDHILPTWAAPEILDGKPYNQKSDVYPMGLMMVEIIERKHPFSYLFLTSSSNTSSPSSLELSSFSFSSSSTSSSSLFSEDKVRKEVVKGRRPPIPSLCSPSLSSLICSCWAQKSEDR